MRKTAVVGFPGAGPLSPDRRRGRWSRRVPRRHLRRRYGPAGAAPGAHARRRAQDPGQRRRPVQHPAVAARARPLRDRLLSEHPTQDAALLAARGAAALLRGGSRPRAGPGAGDRQALPRLEQRPPGTRRPDRPGPASRSEEHTSELQSLAYLVCRLLLEKKKKTRKIVRYDINKIKKK